MPVKLYDSVGPNPRIVRMFMAEKGIEMPKQTVDLRGGENRQAEHLKRNPARPDADARTGRRQLSVGDHRDLRISRREKSEAADDRRHAEERAECRMWTRRVDLNICEPLANGYRFGEALKFFEKRILCAPEASPGLKHDRGEPAAMAERTDGGQGISCAASASRWRISCSTAGSTSATRSASRWMPPTPTSPHGSPASVSGPRRRRRQLQRQCNMNSGSAAHHAASTARCAAAGEGAQVLSTSLRGARATKQSILPCGGDMDCFAEPVIGRAFARPVGSQ